MRGCMVLFCFCFNIPQDPSRVLCGKIELLVEDTSSFGKALFNKGTAGVGVFIAERWIDSVVDVVRVNEWIMSVKLVIGMQIVNIICAYAPQVGLNAKEKDDF